MKFRPQLNQLETREVPSAVSFQLPNGSIGSGDFTAPDGVDPAQGSQVLTLDDLIVVKAGVVYAVQPGATAQYANGILVGVNAIAVGPDTINLTGATVTVGSDTAPLALDGADTQITFQLPDGTVGAISYQIPWDLVDPNLANQVLPATVFNMNIAGQNFSYGSANYTQPPTLHFAHGEFVGVNFALSPPAGFAYTSLSASFDINGNNIITAIQAGTGQQFIAAAPTKVTLLSLDFSKCDTAGYTYELTITVSYKDAPDKSVTITVEEGTTKGGLRDMIESALSNEGVKTKLYGDHRLGIEGTEKNPMSFVKFQAPKGQQGGATLEPSIKDIFQAGRNKAQGINPNWEVKVVNP